MESMVEKTKDEKCGLKQDEYSDPCGKKATHFMVNMAGLPFSYTFLCDEHALWIYMIRRHMYGESDCLVIDRISAIDEMTPEEEAKGRKLLADMMRTMGIPVPREEE